MYKVNESQAYVCLFNKDHGDHEFYNVSNDEQVAVAKKRMVQLGYTMTSVWCGPVEDMISTGLSLEVGK